LIALSALNGYDDEDDPDNPLKTGPDGVKMPRDNAKPEMAFITVRTDLLSTKQATEAQSGKWELVHRFSHSALGLLYLITNSLLACYTSEFTSLHPHLFGLCFQ
jgi:hypothetical protein